MVVDVMASSGVTDSEGWGGELSVTTDKGA